MFEKVIRKAFTSLNGCVCFVSVNHLLGGPFRIEVSIRYWAYLGSIPTGGRMSGFFNHPAIIGKQLFLGSIMRVKLCDLSGSASLQRPDISRAPRPGLQGSIFQSPYGDPPRSRICRDFKWLLFGFSEAYFHFMHPLYEMKGSLAKTRKVTLWNQSKSGSSRGPRMASGK